MIEGEELDKDIFYTEKKKYTKTVIWSEDKIHELNAHQKNGMLHPYTCDRKAPECEVNIEPRDYSKDGVLIATTEGWVCPCGKYKQNWAH